MVAKFRGWVGEKITTFRLWLSLNRKTHRRFDHLILPSKNGTTQIDHLIVSEFGLFIIETKNKKGWIFGSENRQKWTQVIYGQSYTFQNPLRQTYRQKKILSEFLVLDEAFIHTIVYFVGDCKFKTALPENVLRARLGRYIKRFRDRLLSPPDVHRLVSVLENHIAKSTLTTRDHVRSLRQRHSSDVVCPKCGAMLVERTVKKGPNMGVKFLGCERYPQCRYSKSLS